MSTEDRVRRAAERLYEDDPELVGAVLDHAREYGTLDAIASGESVLPHPADARRWLDARLQRTALDAESANKDRRIRDLETRLARLESAAHPDTPPAE